MTSITLLRTLPRNFPNPMNDPASPIPPTRPKGFLGDTPNPPEEGILCTLFFNRSFGLYSNDCNDSEAGVASGETPTPLWGYFPRNA